MIRVCFCAIMILRDIVLDNDILYRKRVSIGIFMKQKVNKNEFIELIAKKNNMDVGTVKTVYDAIISQLTDIVCEGQSLSLTGFGTFTLREHKGHPVQFEARVKSVGGYKVLKFTASDVLMSRIRDRIK